MDLPQRVAPSSKARSPPLLLPLAAAQWEAGMTEALPPFHGDLLASSLNPHPLLRVLTLFSWVVHPHFQQADPVLAVPQAFPLQSVGLDMKFENRALKTPKLEPEMEGQQRRRGRAFGRGDEQGRVVRG